jgi:hypothetical protein
MSKPGFKTSEFWLTAVFVIVALVTQSDVLAENPTWVKVAGLIAGGFAAMGYTSNRGTIKKQELLKNGDAEKPVDPSA